ncbi:phosphatase PAP2 family protein [Parachlamydia sp. AcF125]|uniref:phosphatase PAP2 family protein n=1 Tax=Parachlamydia sp. AcF125 TaxID=2795736 RepID=UPI0020160DEB|nr:phosphatase PAP2 family protein [Parachlamydia sp. AcF125]
MIPIIWLGQGWKTGLRLFYILFFSSLANHALKELFLSPRPFHLDANIGIIQVSGLGFPSGAAQTALFLGGLLCIFWKSSWKWVLALAYILLVSFSRIYLGIHFPSDILGGWLVGFGLLAIYLYARPPIERQLKRLNPLSLFLLSQIVPVLLLIWQSSLRTSSVAMGIGIGVFIVHSYQLFLPSPKHTKEYVLRATVGVLGTFACYTLMSLLPISHSIFYLIPRFLVLGLWISLGSHLVCLKLFPDCKSFRDGLIEKKPLV